MPAGNRISVLLASADPGLIGALEPLLCSAGARVQIVRSADAALEALGGQLRPDLALLDVELPGTSVGRFVAEASGAGVAGVPVLLVSDTMDQEWLQWLSAGIVEDLIPRTSANPHQGFRLQTALLRRGERRELEELRKAAAQNLQTDPLTGMYSRSALLSILFRETDRVQRMKTSLSLLLFDIDDFGHWNTRLGGETCDALLCQVVGRAARVLRSYDLMGRAGEDEFLAVLPGCTAVDAALLAERLRAEVFVAPFCVADSEIVRLSACFGISSSEGRSPVVVLREAELALEQAKESGPESIRCFTQGTKPAPAPVAFLSGASGDELLAW